MPTRRRVLASLAAATVSVATTGIAAAQPVRKPRLAAGRDPGGRAVAIVGSGIDYRDLSLAARLARDGEGEAIALDLVDNDPHPFAAPPANDDAVARIILGEGQATSLVVVRAVPDQPSRLPAALRFVAQTPARIALLVPAMAAPLQMAALLDAAGRLPGLLLVVPSSLVEPPPPGSVTLERHGLLVVAEERSPSPPAMADATVTVLDPRGDVAAGSADAPADNVAAARMAALAARLLAVAPALAGASLRAGILARATRRPGAPPHFPAIRRLHWLE
jgi:hypothetical protein